MLTLLVLLLRRIPIVLATYKWIPDIKTFREAMFAGWFGPMGVGAIFISTLARLALPEGASEKDTEQVDRLKRTIIPIVSFLVLSSIVTREPCRDPGCRSPHQDCEANEFRRSFDIFLLTRTSSAQYHQYPLAGTFDPSQRAGLDHPRSPCHTRAAHPSQSRR